MSNQGRQLEPFDFFSLPKPVVDEIINQIIEESDVAETFKLPLVCHYFNYEVPRVAFGQEGTSFADAIVFLLSVNGALSPVISRFLYQKVWLRKNKNPFVQSLINVTRRAIFVANLDQHEDRSRVAKIVCDTVAVGMPINRVLDRFETPDAMSIAYQGAIPLPLAAALGLESYVANLIRTGTNPNLRDPIFGHAVQAAAYHGHTHIIHSLALLGTDIRVAYRNKDSTLYNTWDNLLSSFGRGYHSPLSTAVIAGQMGALQLLLRPQTLPVEARKGFYYLHHATAHAILAGRVNALQLLLPPLAALANAGAERQLHWLEELVTIAAEVGTGAILTMLLQQLGSHRSLQCRNVSCTACDWGVRAIVAAMQHNRLAMVDILVGFGYHPLALHSSATAITMIWAYNGSPAVKALVSRYAANVPDAQFSFQLLQSTNPDYEDKFRFMLGLHPVLTFGRGYEALRKAVMGRHMDYMALLFNAGADARWIPRALRDELLKSLDERQASDLSYSLVEYHREYRRRRQAHAAATYAALLKASRRR